MRLKLVPWIAAGAMLASATANATPTRVLGLGDLGRYVEDDSNVLMYPGLLHKYAHFMYVDLGGTGPDRTPSSFAESISDGLSAASFVKLSDELQLGIATSSFAPGLQNDFLSKVSGRSNGNSAALDELKFDAIRRYDFLLGYALAKDMGLGLRISYGGSSRSFTPDPDDKTAEAEPQKRLPDFQAQRELTASLGFSGQFSRDFGLDSAVDVTNYSLTNRKNDLDTFDGGGGMGLAANVRARVALTRWWTLVPQLAYRGSFFSLDETRNVPVFGSGNADVPTPFDPGLTQTNKGAYHTFDVGAVAALKASKIATFWVGGGFEMRRNSFVWTAQAEGLDKEYHEANTQYALPYVKFAFEMQPGENVRVRAGAEKYTYSKSQRTYNVDRQVEEGQRKYIDHTTSMDGPLDPAQKDFAAYLGLTLFTQSGLGVDFLIDNQLLKNGFSGLFVNRIALRAAVSYKF